MLFYAGIGSRQTPTNVLQQMTQCAYELHGYHWTLRSGGAPGADSAFEKGAMTAKEIFLPWPRFNNHRSHLHDITPEAYEMARQFHPAWDRCSSAARKFHARNCYQILGYTLNSPVLFVMCWTPNAAITGGTGQALRIAEHHNIPIINMAAHHWSAEYNAQLDRGLELLEEAAESMLY